MFSVGTVRDYERLLAQSLHSVEVETPRNGEFQSASFAFSQHGCFRTSRGSVQHTHPIAGARSKAKIAADVLDEFVLAAPSSGMVVFNQFGRQAKIRPGQMVLIDAAAPYEFERRIAGTVQYTHFPGPIIRDGSFDPRDVCAIAFEATGGIGDVLRAMLTTAEQEIEHLNEHQRARVLRSAASLIATACNSNPWVNTDEPPFVRITEAIDRLLEDPELDCEKISKQTGISRRTLYSVMQKQGTTIGRTILAARLDKCASDLRNAKYGEKLISTVAFRYGFNDFSHFSRSFRARFGQSAKEYREHFACRLA